ncbi:stage II sporulation protein P [Paenibacillus faecalis]|uniref:stage II sporulation protein P n=1 Tax=Paenibacillus faecalis TaxID=2079532 RepID=UPI000D0EFA44|nr:stage II sporulation protein P [Paenibacillus faecalis]
MHNRKFRIWNIARLRRNMMEVLSMGRTLVLLMLGSLLFFLLLGLGGMAEKSMNTSSVSSMKGLAASLSSRFFMDMIGMEMPHVPLKKETSTLTAEKITPFVFELLTSVNPKDPKSLVAGEVPGMKTNQPVPLRTGSGNEKGEAPADYKPDHPPADPENKPDVTAPEEGGDKPVEPPSTSSPGSTNKNGKKGTTSAKKNVLIYHSHPQEAFNPLLQKPSSNPGSSSPNKNILLVGSMIAKRLEAKGIGTIHDKTDYQSSVPDYSWNYSYKYSREKVKSVLSQNEDVTYLIDLHRDSQRHNKTTATINGVNYAQVYFIIGHANKNWRKNEEFASKINSQLEKSYPGISRGVWGKSADQGNGEYNQSLSPNSILIEIGGIDSTKEELQRTANILADIIADVYWQDQKAKKASAMNKQDKGETKNQTAAVQKDSKQS